MIRHKRNLGRSTKMIQGGKAKIKKINHPPQTTNIAIRRQHKNVVITPKGGAERKTFNWNNIKYARVKPIWKGETVFIIGGGPSLSKFDFNVLKNKNTLAINKAVQNCPWADILYWTDSRVYSWLKNDINEFKGDKYTIKPFNTPPDVNALKNTGTKGLELDPSGIRHGNNSGFAAINLAYHLGVKRIVLLGFDMGNTGQKSHYHDGYPVSMTANKIYEERMLPTFDSLVQPLKENGVEIINASMVSKIKCFRKMPIEKALLFS